MNTTILIKESPRLVGTVTKVYQSFIGSANIHGTEVEIFGQPTRRLTVFANYGSAKGHQPFTDGTPFPIVLSPTTIKKIRNTPPPVLVRIRAANPRLIEPVTMSEEAVIVPPS